MHGDDPRPPPPAAIQHPIIGKGSGIVHSTGYGVIVQEEHKKRDIYTVLGCSANDHHLIIYCGLWMIKPKIITYSVFIKNDL